MLTAAAGALAALIAAGQPEPVLPTAAAARVPAGVSPGAEPSPSAEPTPSTDPLAAPAGPAEPTPTLTTDPLILAVERATAVTAAAEWASFTLIDQRTDRVVGDRRAAGPTNSESAVKAWLGADLLATRAAAGEPLSGWEQSLLDGMIRVSDDDAAEVIWRSLGGDTSIARMIRTCELTDTTVWPTRWAMTQISSRDLARVGVCIAPGLGKLLSPAVGAPLLRLMRTVDASNAFGIQEAEPAGKGVRIAVKNGWTEHGGTGLWNVNCLAMWGTDLRYVLAVTTRYPVANGLAYGADLCRRVTTALFP